jgi:Predicted acyl-CoA transferases/carnitine dehydratase
MTGTKKIKGVLCTKKVIDAAIEEWTRKHTAEEVLSFLAGVSVPAGPFYGVEGMFYDEPYFARGMFPEVEANGRTLPIPAMLPILTATPGTTVWAGPALSEHTSVVLVDMLG